MIDLLFLHLKSNKINQQAFNLAKSILKNSSGLFKQQIIERVKEVGPTNKINSSDYESLFDSFEVPSSKILDLNWSDLAQESPTRTPESKLIITENLILGFKTFFPEKSFDFY